MTENDESVRSDGREEYPESPLAFLINTLISIESLTRSGKSIPLLIQILRNDEVVYYRTVAAKLFGAVTWNPNVVNALIEALKDEKRPHRFEDGLAPKSKPPSVQERAIVSLIDISDERGLSAVIPKVAQKDKFGDWIDDIEEKDTVELLAEIGIKKPDALIQALQEKAMLPRSITRIVSALGNTDNPKAVEPLIKVLGHPNKDIRSSAANALGKLNDVRALEPLLKSLQEKTDFAGWAIERLIKGREDDQQVQKLLIKQLDNKDAHVRAWVAERLGNLGAELAISALEQALLDEDRKVRNLAKKALKKIVRMNQANLH